MPDEKLPADAPVNESILPVNTPESLKPGAFGWTPTEAKSLLGACLLGAAGAAGAFLEHYDPTHPLNYYGLAGVALMGCATGAGAYLGIRSAGVRKVP